MQIILGGMVMILFHKHCLVPQVYEYCYFAAIPSYTPQAYERPQYNYQQQTNPEPQRTTKFTGGKG